MAEHKGNGVYHEDSDNNPYIDTAVINASQQFSPNENTAFIQQHSVINNNDTDSPKENDNTSSNSSGSGFVVLDEHNNGGLNGHPQTSSTLSSEFENITSSDTQTSKSADISPPTQITEDMAMDEADKFEEEPNNQQKQQQNEEEEEEKYEQIEKYEKKEEKYKHKNTENKTSNNNNTYYQYPLYSIETGLHSLLTSMNYPISSEVLITSLISPWIIRVIELHGLIPKPIDINFETMEPMIKIEELITDKTRMIIIGHLFGFTVSIPDMTDLRDDILIIEDCSETYPYDGCNKYTDIKMYKFMSYNPINSIPNGAMFKFKDKSLMQKVKNISSTYSKQSMFMYFWTLFLCHLLSPLKNKYMMRIFVKFCYLFSIQYDKWFIPKLNMKQFMNSLELRPSIYLNKTIEDGMKFESLKHKMDGANKKREAVLDLLSSINDITIIGKLCKTSSFCCFPVCIKNRDRVIGKMRYYGYNVDEGRSRLIAIQNSCISNDFVSNVIYLPLHDMDLKSFKKMLVRFKKLISLKKPNNKKKSIFMRCISLQIVCKALMVLFILRYIWLYLLILGSILYYFLRPSRKFRDCPYNGIKEERIISSDKVCIIITGCTGFLGEVLVKDLLDSYPSNEIKLYLIIRGKKNLSASQRCIKIFGDNKNISVIDGELETLDIDSINISERITHIIHSAGNVKFSAPHSSIAKTNILCSLKMKKLADKFNAKFIYVSTAFVHGADSSKSTNYLNATPIHLADDGYCAEKLYHLMLGNREEIDEYMVEYDIENNYVLSKIISENLIGSTSIIIRPSIITPSWNFPKPSWGGRTPSTVTFCVAGVAARLMRVPARSSITGQQSMPIIPVDFVTKCIIDNLNADNNTIHLAALNTQTKYNKVCSFWELAWMVLSYLYSMEILTSFEVVLVRACVILSALNIRIFYILSYLFNELFAPSKYRGILKVIYQYQHFSHNSFEVEHGITPNIDFNGKKYISMIMESACELIEKPVNDLRATIPFWKWDKNLMISITNTCFSFILHKTTNKVIVDTDKLKHLSSKKNIVLLPNHRSFYDFLLVCKICIKYQMYGLSMPLSFATSKFKQSPLIAMCMKMMNTIFIDSGSNNIKNGYLQKKIKEKKDKNNVYQLFIEGTRSRNRQFLKGHHGALSILAEQMDLTIVPITINYERIPEQNTFYRELDGEKSSFSVLSLIGWFYDVIIKNNVFLGDINIKIGDLIEVPQRNYNKNYFTNLINKIQYEQMKMVNITKYHTYYFEKELSLKLNVEKFLNKKGCKVYPTSINLNTNPPKNDKEIYMLTLQFAHYLADYMDSETKYWLTNGNIISNDSNESKDDDEGIELIKCIKTLIDRYRSFNYLNKSLATLKFNKYTSSSIRINVNNESLGYWGYNDSYFCLKEDKLFFNGSRYEISDKYFVQTISFLSKLSNIPLLRKKGCFPVLKHKQDLNNMHDEIMRFLINIFGSKYVSRDIHLRYHHGTGHTVSDMLNLRINNKNFRIPDIIIYPQNKQQLIKLINNCLKLNICLIPYGGGTNVTHALWCDPSEKRIIISVDMSMMNKIIWINRENQTASISAGITGKKLECELNACGFTTGHYPDSYEFSTLGGWIATYASGMKRTKYGNIEEIVIDFEVLTANGIINRNMGVYGRVSSGTNYLNSFFGSEGTLGIIISAVVRLHKLPDIVEYDSIVFPDWNSGLNMMKMVKNISSNCRPAVLRLVDNTQFKLSQTFKDKKKNKTKSFLSKLYVTKWRGFNIDTMCAATIVYEGNKTEIKIQQNIINKLILSNNGIRGGSESGKAGFNLTFAIAYIRDFLLENFGILAESFETFIPWDKINGFKDNLHSNILNKHSDIGLIGNPFLSSRISQIYNEGVCLYLYYGFYVDTISIHSLSIFDEMEEFIRKEMLNLGGSISHHHGIGKLRAKILKNDLSSKQIIKLAQNVKNAFDPNNIFAANNGLLFK